MVFYHPEYLAVAALERQLRTKGKWTGSFERWRGRKGFNDNVLHGLFQFLDQHMDKEPTEPRRSEGTRRHSSRERSRTTISGGGNEYGRRDASREHGRYSDGSGRHDELSSVIVIDPGVQGTTIGMSTHHDIMTEVIHGGGLELGP